MDTRHRIIFSGQIKEGFEPVLVKKLAALKLKATPEQITRLFSGRKAIIKKNLSLQRAERYASELEKLGLIVVVTAETKPVEAPVIGLASVAGERHNAAEEYRGQATTPFFDSLTTQLNISALTPSRFTPPQ